MFDEAKVPASCTVNGILCERHPQIVTAAAKRGWELIAHNYIQTEFMVNYREDRDKEREVIKRVLDLIEKTTGKRPEGLAVVVAPLHGQHLRHLQGARADLPLRLHERRAAVSDQHRPRAAGVDSLHPRGERHRHVPRAAI